MFDLVELFCRIDDFCKNFESLWKSHLLILGKSLPKRTSALSTSEVMIILILFHFIRYRDFKTFYQNHLSVFFRKEFPHLGSYTQFIELKKKSSFASLLLPIYSIWQVFWHLLRRLDFSDRMPSKTNPLS